MRQGGVLASACLYALDHHIDRLADDHRNAQVLAQAINDTPGLELDPPTVETNLVWFNVDPSVGSARDVSLKLKEKGVLISASGPQTMRAVAHLDVSAAQAERAADIINKTLRQLRPSELGDYPIPAATTGYA